MHREPAPQWPDLLQPYIKNEQVFACPSSQYSSTRPTGQYVTKLGLRSAYTLNKRVL